MISKKQAKARNARAGRRVARVRAKIRGAAMRPRLTMHKSSKHVSVQIIDDQARRTLCAAGDHEVDKKLRGIARAAAVGKLIAERAKEKKIIVVIFDRRQHQYHGQVKALAEAAREAGLQF